MTIRARICVGLLLLLPIAVYWQTVFHEFGLRDDYSLPREAHLEPGKLLRLTASNGRPIYAILLESSLEPVYVVEDLQWLRLIGVILLTAIAVGLWGLLRRAGWSELEAVAVGVVIALLPASQITAAWAISWPNALALALAVAGFAFVENGLAQAGRKRSAAFAGGVVCYFLAGLTYQSNALFAVVPLAALLLVRAGADPLNHVRWIAAHLAALLASLAAGFLLMNVLFSLGVFPEAARMHFETDPLGKLLWFLWQPVANSLALVALRDRFDTGAPWFWTAVLIVAAIIALGFRFDAGRLHKMKWLVCLLFLPFVAHAVSLAAVQRAIGYRTLFALSGLVVVLVVFALRSLRSAGKIKALTHQTALALLLLAAAIAANRNSFTLIAEPQGREWAIVRDAAHALPLHANTKIYIITPSVEDRSTRRVFADEFGSVSTNSDWVPREMFHAAMRERFPDGLPPGTAYTVALGALPPDAKAHDLVIDLRKLRDHRAD